MDRFDIDDEISISSDSQSIEPLPKVKKSNRGRRRTADNDTSKINTSKKAKGSDANANAVLPYHGYPLEHPYNKDGYSYILTEPDYNADWKDFEMDSFAGKPIPGEIYRVSLQPACYLSLHDRAAQLKVSDDRLTVSGEKGYCSIRSNYGVSRGNWYYEISVTNLPGNTATRLGWCQPYGNLQAPLGYDKFSYSWRSIKGTRFHQSLGKHYSNGYNEGDVLGFHISLPEPNILAIDFLPESHKEEALIKFKNFKYYEEKDISEQVEKTLKTAPGTSMSFFRNGLNQGTAFTDLYEGTYHPAASLYKNATVTFNYGPKFKYPPKDVDYKPMSDFVDQMAVEQSVADLRYLVSFEDEKWRKTKKSVRKR